jgi:hypothetical protein
MDSTTIATERAWDARVAHLLAKLPDRLRSGVEWLRVPSRRWLRLGAAVLLILGGFLSVLPVFGLWMLPLGLALMSDDIPWLKVPLEKAARGVERPVGARPRRPEGGLGAAAFRRLGPIGLCRRRRSRTTQPMRGVPAMAAPQRAALGFAAAVLSVLTFHQGMWALLHAAGIMPPAPYPTNPVPPFGVPLIASLCFWGGLYGLGFGLALPRLPRAPMWLLGLGLGLLAAVVGWFVVAPLKGQPVAGGFVPLRMLVSVLINGAWGIGVGVILPLLGARRSVARA